MYDDPQTTPYSSCNNTGRAMLEEKVLFAIIPSPPRIPIPALDRAVPVSLAENALP